MDEKSTELQELERLKDLSTKAYAGDKEAMFSYAEAILYFTNKYVSDFHLQQYINAYALDLLSELAEDGLEPAQAIIDDYGFEDNQED